MSLNFKESELSFCKTSTGNHIYHVKRFVNALGKSQVFVITDFFEPCSYGVSLIRDMQNPLCSLDNVPYMREAFDLMAMKRQYRGDCYLHWTCSIAA